jgi:hypothetical protein
VVRTGSKTDWIEALGQDLRYAARGLCKSPVFTLVAVLTLAIGIGGTTTIFSAIDVLLLRPLPYPEQDRLVALSFAGLAHGCARRWSRKSRRKSRSRRESMPSPQRAPIVEREHSRTALSSRQSRNHSPHVLDQPRGCRLAADYQAFVNPAFGPTGHGMRWQLRVRDVRLGLRLLG